tara:strand:- start:836 stop:1039 length:204 start_codon:yes stop_codon:yes gene_type:complete
MGGLFGGSKPAPIVREPVAAVPEPVEESDEKIASDAEKASAARRTRISGQKSAERGTTTRVGISLKD